VSLAPSFKWNVNRKSIRRITDIYLKKNTDAIQNVIEGTASYSADWIRDFKVLQNSRTGTLWHDYINEERGNAEGARVDTGLMANSVGYTRAQYQSEGEYIAEFGLLLPSAGGRKYFLEQDEGFQLELANGKVRDVPGMQTYESVEPQLKKRMSKEMLRHGFLRGGRDSRGMRILQNSEREGFNTAWSSEYAPSEAQITAAREMQQRGAQARIVRDAYMASRTESYRTSGRITFGSANSALNRKKR